MTLGERTRQYAHRTRFQLLVVDALQRDKDSPLDFGVLIGARILSTQIQTRGIVLLKDSSTK